MLQLFIAWAQSVPNAQVTFGMPTSNTSVRVDFESAEVLGRIACWETGDYHAEVLDAVSGDTIYSQLGNLETATQLAEQFLPFMKAMGAR